MKLLDRVDMFLERNLLTPHKEISMARQRAIGGAVTAGCFEEQPASVQLIMETSQQGGVENE